jgi:hypothetical protein
MRKNIRTGVIVGLVMATIYAIYALAVFGLRGPDPFSSQGTTVGSVVLMYYAAGTIGGAVVGMMSPLTRTWIGMAFAGASAGTIIVFCGCVSLYGGFWQWDADVWKIVAIFGPALGVTSAIMWRKVIQH